MAPTADVLPAAEASTRPGLLVQPSDTKLRKASSFRTEQVVIDGNNLKIQGLVASARYGHIPIVMVSKPAV